MGLIFSSNNEAVIVISTNKEMSKAIKDKILCNITGICHWNKNTRDERGRPTGYTKKTVKNIATVNDYCDMEHQIKAW